MAFPSFRRTWPASRLLPATVLAGVWMTTNPAAFSATLLDFPAPVDILAGRFLTWHAGSTYLTPTSSVAPFRFTYAVDSGFLANQASLTPGLTSSIVADALQQWSLASRGGLQFAPAPWDAVRNEGLAPPDQWEGPSVQQWLTGQFPGTFPGWGANIDLFSVPTGFTIDSQGFQFTMGPSVLAFTIVNRVGSAAIVSVDIYLNDSFAWYDDATSPGGTINAAAGTEQAAVFDVRAVLLHELGHAFGLDHPNQAVAKGSWNLNPLTFASGDPWSPSDLMYSVYQGPRLKPTLDEVGGLALAYGWASPVDLDQDGTVTGADLAHLLSDWAMVGNQPSDINFDSVVNAIDLTLMLSSFGAKPELPSASTSMLPPDAGTADVDILKPSPPIFRQCYAGPHREAAAPR